MMKRFTIAAVAFGCFAVALILAGPSAAHQQDETKSDEPRKLEQVRKERIESLELLVKVLEMQSKAGTAKFTEYMDSQEDLIQAKLEATGEPEERIALLKEQLKVADDAFTYAEKVVKVGREGSEVLFLRAKAHRLNAEINLLKEIEKNEKK
jgi:hypothetical protein